MDEWISVEDGVPGGGLDKFVTCDEYGNIRVHSDIPLYMPKYWMPLPEPPKEGKQ